MADSTIMIYTKILKRMSDALLNLQEGNIYLKDFKDLYKIDSILLVDKNIPEGFVAEDYSVEQLIKDIDNMVLSYKTFIDKFSKYDEENVIDPLNILGKKFWVYGDTITR